MEKIENLYFDQITFLNNIHLDALKNAREKMINELIKMDFEIKNSDWRLKKGWYIKDVRFRKQKTTIGTICFPRTRYWNKYTGEYKYLLDDHINIKKRKRLIPSLENEILNRVGNGNRYCDIADALRFSDITEQTISNVVKRFNVTNEALEELECNKVDVSDKEYVYLGTDDTFPNLIENRKKKKFRVRLFYSHTGVKKGMWNRNHLENKRIDYEMVQIGGNISTAKFANRVKKFLNKFYENINEKQLILTGDAAMWIPNLADELGAKYVLDKFHLIKEVGRIFPITSKHKTKKIKFYKYAFFKIRKIILNGNSFEKIIDVCNSIYKKLYEKNWFEKLEDLTKFINFVKRNKIGIKNYYKEFDSSSHTEGQISSFVKSTIGYGKKIYSKNNFVNLLNIKKLKINGYDFNSLLEYDLETIQIQNIEYNSKYVDEFKSVGYLNRDKKLNLTVQKGKSAYQKQPGFKYNSH